MSLVLRLQLDEFAEIATGAFGLGLIIAVFTTLVLGLMDALNLLPLTSLVIALLFLLIRFRVEGESLQDGVFILSAKLRQVPRRIRHVDKSALLLMGLFLLSVCLATFREIDFYRNSDEYKNLDWAWDMMNDWILTPSKLGREGFDWYQGNSVLEVMGNLQRYVYQLSLTYFLEIGGYSIATGVFMSAVFTGMLVLGTYMIGNLKDKRTGLTGAALVSTNPVIVTFSTHIMTDIPMAALSILSLYFFMRAYRNENVDNGKFLLALGFIGMAVFTKPLALFILPVVSAYAMVRPHTKDARENFKRLIPLFVFLGLFLLDAVRAITLQHPNPSFTIFSDGISGLVASLAGEPTILLGAYTTFGYPLFYGYSVLVLVAIGVTDDLVLRKDRDAAVLLTIMLLVFWLFSFSKVVGGTIRRVILVFPLLFYFAARGAQSTGKHSFLSIPFFLTVLLLPLYIGYIPYFPIAGINDLFYMSVVICIFVIALKFSQCYLQMKEPLRHGSFTYGSGLTKPSLENHVKVRKNITVFLIVTLISLGGIWSSYLFVTQGHQEINEELRIDDTGISMAIDFLAEEAPQNSTVGANEVFAFQYYLKQRSSKNFTIVELPGTYRYSAGEASNLFKEMLEQGIPDFLVLFKNLGYERWYPYMNEFLQDPFSSLVEIVDTDSFSIYQRISLAECEMIFNIPLNSSWVPGFSRDLRPDYQMATSSFDVNGTDLTFNGFTVSDANDTRSWAHWISTSYFALIDTMEFGFLAVKVKTLDNFSIFTVNLLHSDMTISVLSVGSSTVYRTAVLDLRNISESHDILEVRLMLRGYCEGIPVGGVVTSLVFFGI